MIARDTTALYSVLAEDVTNSFGGDGGIEEFKATWRPADVDSEIWARLLRVLSRGGRWDGRGGFVAPYTFRGLPEGLDPFEHLVVIDADVIGRAAPDASSDAVATLSFDIVRVDSAGAASGWRHVTLGDGRRVYVESRHLVSALDYRAGFRQVGGTWKMVFFVAGD